MVFFNKDLRIVNVSSAVYEILEMTGFTEMMPVEKAYRVHRKKERKTNSGGTI